MNLSSRNRSRTGGLRRLHRFAHRVRDLLVVATFAAVMSGAAWAAEYAGPVRIVVGFPPGGGADVAARAISDRLALELKQPVVVENRPGAGGQIAAQLLKGSPADGSVLMLTNTHTVITVPLTVKAPGFALGKDLLPIGGVATFEVALSVSAQTGVKRFDQLGTWFAEHRREASIGVPAPASAPEFMATRIARHLGIDSVPVPYKGSAPMIPDLLGGTIPSVVSGVSDVLQYQKTGRVHVLAVTRRTPLLPNVPSFEELGVAGLELPEILGLYAPAGMDPAIVQRYNAALHRTLSAPEIRERLQGQDLTPIPGTPEEHAQRLARQEKLLAELIAATGFRP